MFLRLIAFLILATLISCKNAIAETIEDGRYWFSLYTQGPLPKENFKITPKTSIWSGYDTINNHPAGQSSFQENRLWEQVMHQFEPFGGLTLTVRTRFEQRDREDYSDIAHRLRQMVRATTPSSLHQQLSWVVWDELFINLNQTDWGVMRGTDQNRLFLGANWKFDELSNLEVGYINQYVNGKTIDRENHILSSTIRFNF
jgi:hypothetical protein